MSKILLVWLLFGAFAGSASLNLYYARSWPEPAPEPSCACDMRQGIDDQACWKLTENVALTLEQKKQLSNCCAMFMQCQARLDERTEKLVEDLGRALGASEPDADTVHGLVEQIGALRTEALKRRIDNILTVRKTLTADQLKRLIQCSGG